ncbi:TenA family protein [Rhizobium sp. EC-SD404]|uniref:TenA family protein n=1 Tax=Rhizobium sp. EC-SD404 TaxID=2038389 RepID=UPI0012552148|nr:TenA family protein [Rhizobium sp. EC-SD404]VVS97669.1 Aminopyrimidine aminohydrolase [Rhizobium sp. EC-SD404]
MTLTDRLLSENADVLDAMLNHRFVRAVGNDVLSPSEFDAYLVYEGAFVETAISIFAHMLTRAETMEDKRRIITILDALANEQIAYFEAVFLERGITPADYPLPGSVIAFDSGMAEVARNGTFADIACAMFAAEWMYMTWSRNVDQDRLQDAHLATWVRLHTDPGFVDQAHWLRRKVDEAGDDPDIDIDRISAIFRRVLELEITFHDAPLAGASVQS